RRPLSYTLDESAPRPHNPGLRFHRRPRRGSGAGDRRGDANRGGVLTDVTVVEPEEVELFWTRVAQRHLVAGHEHRSLGQRRAATTVQYVTAEDGTDPPR